MNDKLLVKNSLFNILYRCINIVFPLITSVYVARILQADSIGKIAAAQNIVSYFTLLAAMGIPTYGVKLIAQYNKESDESSRSFWELFIINAVLSVVCTLAYYILTTYHPYFQNEKLLLYIVGLNLLFNVINVDWFYQGIQEYGYIAIRSLFFKMISLLAMFCFVKNKEDYIIYALIISLACVGNYIFNIIRIKKYINRSFTHLDIMQHIRPVLILFAATVASEIYVLADTTMLDIMTNNTVVGYYSMSMKIIKSVRTLVVAISAVFLPQMSYYFFNGELKKFDSLVNKGLHIILVVSLPIATGLCILSQEFTTALFGSNFDGSVLSTSILSFSIITVALSNFIGMQFLVTIGKEKIITISTCLGAIVNIILNYFLIQNYQHYGAAIASVVTEFVVTTTQIVLARRYQRFQFGIKTVLVPTICMIIAILCLKILPVNGILKLGIVVVVAIVVYIVVAIIVKDKFVLSIQKAVTDFFRRKQK